MQENTNQNNSEYRHFLRSEVCIEDTTMAPVMSLWFIRNFEFNKPMELVFFLWILEIYAMFCAIWNHSYNFKNMKNTHGGVLLLVELQPFTRILAFNFLKSSMGVFHIFKIVQMVPDRARHHIFDS